ncbi:outer membrane beta-barrel protein [Enterovibrio calviensis]|uniref:outer membrane beta-barrel protein n=1 Tax=Enterovibrio calviensis TaxID=91359 RepID=UPI00048A16EA|nr:outer membrane beta-barrel protein [Enterovibrio calviensis]
MIRSHLWISAGLFFPLSAAAVEPLAYQTENGIDILPTLKVSAGNNDNVRRTTDDTVSSPESVISPKVTAVLKKNRSAYQFDYGFDAVNYSNSSDDNYIDHQLHGQGFFVFDVRNRLLIDYLYNITNEPRGTGITEGFSLSVDEPTRFQRHNLKARYTYGAAGTKGRLAGVAGYESKEYDDVTYIRNGLTQESRYFNWNQPYLSSEFYYAVSNYFYAVAVASLKDRNYEYIEPFSGITRDSLDSALYGGLEWDITGKTQGKLLVGVQNKDFEASQREDFQGFIWRANMSWAPTDYSTFGLEGRDYARDPNINADYVKDRSIQLDWEHKWTPRFKSIASARYGTNEYPLGVRKDDDTLYEITVVYSLKRWWDISVGASRFERDSSLVGYSYEQTRLFIGMEVSL